MSTLAFRQSDYFEQQWAFLTCPAKIHAYIGGYGAGKTHVFIRKCLWALINLKSKSGKSNGRVIYPTYDLADELFVGPFCDLLDELRIKYDYNVSRHLLKTAYGNIRIFQLQKPARIVGSELTWAGFDEFDVESWKNCHTAFMKTIGRMRGTDDWQMFFVSTPEGTHYLHKIFVSDNQANERKLFRAKTDDNTYLPKGYVEDLQRNYDAKLLAAYRDGEFVNLTSGTVYHQFSKANVKPVAIDPRLPVAVMCDFNRGVKPMCWNVGQIVGDELLIKSSLHRTHTNTYDMCTMLEGHLYELFGGQIPALHFYGDYSGYKDTSNSTKTDWDIIEGHFSNKAQKLVTLVKPTHSVRDGVNAVNRMLMDGKGQIRLWVDPSADWLIHDFELTVWDGAGMREDQSNDDRSHSVSAVRYLIDYEFPLHERVRRV